VCNGDSGGPLNYIVSLNEEAEISRANQTSEEPTTVTPIDPETGDIVATTVLPSAFAPGLSFTSHRDSLRRVAVVGVTSFGVGVFNFPNIIRIDFCTGPAAYTRVPFYNDFIKQRIGRNNLCYV
jgi:secreted trypsin-like serine protease